MFKGIKIKIQIKVLNSIKETYEKEMVKAKEKYEECKINKNEKGMNIQQCNIEYFNTNILTLNCMIDDIHWKRVI